MPQPKQPVPTIADWPLRARLRYGIIMASLSFAVLTVPIIIVLAALGAAAGWWFGVGAYQSARQAIAFGLIALAISWVFVVLRAVFRPDLVRRPDAQS